MSSPHPSAATTEASQDEVAAHLDGDRRRSLYAEIQVLGCQAWMTGTGPELFDGTDARQYAISEQGGVSALEPA